MLNYRFKRTVVALLSTALLLAACALSDSRPAPEGAIEKGGALDVILLSEHSPEAGSLLFNHRLHYAPLEKGGYEIPCAECHHDIQDDPGRTPRACGDCHDNHHDNRYPDRLTL